MYRILLLLIALAITARAQYTPPITVCDAAGDPVCIPQITKIIVDAGSLTPIGKTARISNGGGGSITLPFAATDALDNTTPNYTSFLVNVNYNGTAGSPGTLVNLGLASRLTYGAVTPATGTQHNITTTIDVVGSAAPNNEFSNLMGWMRFTQPGRAWFTDWSLHGAIAQQQQLLNGATMLVNNYFNGAPTNAPSAAFIAVTAEGKGAGGETAWNLAETYPVDIGFAVVGHAGNPGVATLRRGFNVGFMAGSNASGWMVPTEQSWIGVGFQAVDYDTAGIVIGTPRGTNTKVLQVAPNLSGGASTWDHLLDFNSVVPSTDVAAGGSILRLPNVADAKAGILFGAGGSRLRVGANNIVRIDGKLGVGGDMTTGSALFEVIGSASVSDPLVAFGSPGATDANSFKFYNGSGDLTHFIAGGAGQFVPNTAQGDGGIRSVTNKKFVLGDTTGARLILDASVASPVNFLRVGNAATGNRPTLNPDGTDGSVGVTSTQKGSGAFVIESGSGLNDVVAAAIRRTGTTRGFNFIPSVSPNADPHLRLASGQTWTTAFFNEVDGAIASLAINTSQSGARTNSTVGGIFRLDTRTGIGGLANGEQAFVIYGVPTGGDSPVVRFASSLQDGNTLLNLNGGTTGVGHTTAPAQQFSVTSLSTTRVGEAISSAANSTVDLINWFNNVDDTSTVANLATFDSRSNGTPANGFGHSITHLLETTTTNARTAATESVFWTNATEGSQVSAIAFGTVNAGTLAERVRVDFFGIQLSAVTQANLGTPANGHVTYCSDCTIANPCAGGGGGAIAKRLGGAWVCN